MIGRGGFGCLCAVALAMLAPTAASAAPADLDTAFSGDGKLVTDLGDRFLDSGWNAVKVDSGGRVVAAGAVNLGSGDSDLIVARYLAGGGLDTTFGGGDGFVTADAGRFESAASMSFDSSNRIVVAGTTDVNGASFGASPKDFLVARFTSGGQLDTTFANQGLAITDLAGDGDVAAAVAVDSVGRIAVTGSSLEPETGHSFSVVRYTSGGALDTTFSGNGKKRFHITPGSTDDISSGLAIGPSDSIVVTGSSQNYATGQSSSILARLTSTGVLDTGFSGDGIEPFTGLYPTGVGIAASNSIYVVGSAPGKNYGAVRFGSTGARDLTYGDSGVAGVSVSGFMQGFTLQPDGTLTITGQTSSISPDGVATVRLLPSGQPDSSYSGDGLAETSVPGSTNAYGLAVAVDGAGRTIVAGSQTYAGPASESFNNGGVLLRYSTTGAIDSSFGSSGFAGFQYPIDSIDEGVAVAIDSSQRVLVAGTTDRDPESFNTDLFLARYTAAGVLDTTFGGGDGVAIVGSTGGFGFDEARDVAFDSLGRIVVAGADIDYPGSPFESVVLARFSSSGALDATFGSDGVSESSGVPGSPNSLAIDASDRPVIAGRSNVSGGYRSMIVARFDTAGALDTTFADSNGYAKADFGATSRAKGVALDSTGKIVAGGQADTSFAAARFTTTGALDPTFSSDGMVTAQLGGAGFDGADALAIDGSNKVLLAGDVDDDFTVARFTAAGALDPSFSGDGKATADLGGTQTVGSVGLDSSGRILVAGTAADNFGLVRFTTAGALDLSFDGADGATTTGFGAAATAEANDLAIGSNGSIVLAGSYSKESAGQDDLAIARYLGGNGPAPTPRSLSVTLGGSGSGSVSGSGIDCPGDCAETYANGTQLTLTATPDPESTFTGWSGACSGTGECNLTMGANKTVTATFSQPAAQRTLTVSSSGPGKITGPGINCPSDCTQSYPQGTTVNLTATPQTDASFLGWDDSCVGSGACSVTMNFDSSVTGYFDFDDLSPDPPETRIQKTKVIKKGKKRTLKATFSGAGGQGPLRYDCKLDKSRWGQCTSPVKYKLKKGKHVFRVRAIDSTGEADRTPAKKKFKA